MNIMPHRPASLEESAARVRTPSVVRRWGVGFYMVVMGGLGFALISADVVYHGGLWRFDRMVATYLFEHVKPSLIWPASVCSGMGDRTVLVPVAVFVGGWLIFRRQWRSLMVWAVGLIGSVMFNAALKTAFALPRPYATSQFILDSSFTYPSGHTMGAAITAGLLALVWMRVKARTGRARVGAAMVAAAFGMLEASALVYIGVHYVSDVLAALALALVWLGVLRAMLPPAVPGEPEKVS